jgi:NAD(P)-dependent dehydrogenase (short-subunit alcohol dehydrogenase family)
MKWPDQVAVVTGGSRGIGRATALLLARRGCAVCVNYMAHAERAEGVAREIKADGGRAIAFLADIADHKAVTSMVERVTTDFGPITILINNAGYSQSATLDTYDQQQFERMRRVNVEGMIHTTRAVMGGMCQLRYGRIVNVASIAAFGTALPGTTFYAATKAEVITLTRRFALELGSHGVTVNAVAPGFVRTDMTQARRSEEEWAKIEHELGQRAMVRRIGEPNDIAHAVAFLAAPESGFITAQTLVIDGGRIDYISHG